MFSPDTHEKQFDNMNRSASMMLLGLRDPYISEIAPAVAAPP